MCCYSLSTLSNVRNNVRCSHSPFGIYQFITTNAKANATEPGKQQNNAKRGQKGWVSINKPQPPAANLDLFLSFSP